MLFKKKNVMHIVLYDKIPIHALSAEFGQNHGIRFLDEENGEQVRSAHTEADLLSLEDRYKDKLQHREFCNTFRV